MKYDFSKVTLQDIEGNDCSVQDVHKVIGNLMYNTTRDLDLVDKATLIYKGEPVELDKVEIAEILRLVDDPKAGLYAFARKAIRKYVEDTKNQ